MAVTISFDDGHAFDRRVVAAFNAWGLKATFNLNSGRLGRAGRPADEVGDRPFLDASEVADLYRGHEVAAHTVTHPHLDRLTDERILAEVLEDRRALEELIGKPVRGMAYPYGAYDGRVIEVLREAGMAYARTCENAECCFPPPEPLAWATSAHQFAQAPSVPERFGALSADRDWSGVFHVWGHAFEFHDRRDWGALERIYRPLSGRDDVWYCTNIELFDHEDARRRVVVAPNRESARNPSARVVTLNVDGRLVDLPPGGEVCLRPAG